MTSPLNQITKKLDDIDAAKKWLALDAGLNQTFNDIYQEVRICFYQKPEVPLSGNVKKLVEIDINEIKSLTVSSPVVLFFVLFVVPSGSP